jgi:hypothetical protein
MSQVRSIALATVVTALASSSHARASTGFGAELVLGVAGEAEADQIACQTGCTGSQALSDEDLEKNYGVAVTYERALRPQVRLGARASYLKGEGDDTDQEVAMLGIGAWGRYLIPMGSVTAHLGADLGPTYATSEVNVVGLEMDFAGVGFHGVVGGGISVPLSGGLEFRSGLYYSYEAISSLEADDTVQGTKIEVEIEDVVVTRVLITAGLQF